MVMMCATLAQHLGLPQAVADVVSRIAGCPMCCSFWSSLLVLVLIGCDTFIAVGLSLLMAYLSHWFGLVLMMFNGLYDGLWRRARRRRRSLR